jgi:hypothetical protein
MVYTIRSQLTSARLQRGAPCCHPGKISYLSLVRHHVHIGNSVQYLHTNWNRREYTTASARSSRWPPITSQSPPICRHNRTNAAHDAPWQQPGHARYAGHAGHAPQRAFLARPDTHIDQDGEAAGVFPRVEGSGFRRGLVPRCPSRGEGHLRSRSRPE